MTDPMFWLAVGTFLLAMFAQRTTKQAMDLLLKYKARAEMWEENAAKWQANAKEWQRFAEMGKATTPELLPSATIDPPNDRREF